MSQIGSMPFPTPSRESGFALIATMKSAAIIQGWLPLESLLAAAVFERTGKMREDALALVPLDSRMLTGDVTPDARLWLASGANLLGHVTTAEETIIRRRRREETGPEFYTANPRARTTDPFAIEQRSYDFKALLRTYHSVQCQALVWFGRGNAQQCAELVESLAFIGKRRGQGYGQISGVSIQAFNGDPVLWHNGLVRRPIPATWLPMLKGAASIDRQQQAYVSARHPAWAYPAELCAVPASRQIGVTDLTYGLTEIEDGEQFFG